MIQKPTASDVKQGSTKEHQVQPERGVDHVDVGDDQTKDGWIGRRGVERECETTKSKRGKRRRPIRRKWGSGAKAKRGNGTGDETRDVQERESN